MSESIRFNNGISKAILFDKVLLAHTIFTSAFIIYYIGPISLIWYMVVQLIFVLSEFLSFKNVIGFYKSFFLFSLVSTIVLFHFYFRTPCLSDALKTFVFGVVSLPMLLIYRNLDFGHISWSGSKRLSLLVVLGLFYFFCIFILSKYVY